MNFSFPILGEYEKKLKGVRLSVLSRDLFTFRIIMEIFKDIDELKELTDKLMLRTLELVEEDVTLKINIEKLTNEGALLMAKTR